MIGPGDVVVCIADIDPYDIDAVTLFWFGTPIVVPKKGEYYRVVGAKQGPENWYLKLREIPGEWCFRIDLFRKVEKGKDVFTLVTKKDAPKELEHV